MKCFECIKGFKGVNEVYTVSARGNDIMGVISSFEYALLNNFIKYSSLTISLTLKPLKIYHILPVFWAVNYNSISGLWLIFRKRCKCIR